MVPVRPYTGNVSLKRLGSHRDFGRGLEKLATTAVASGELERPDIILASLPPLEGPEAAARLASRLDSVLVVDLMDLWPETFERLLPLPGWLRDIVSPVLLGGMKRRRRQVLELADGVSAATATYAERSLADVPGQRPTHVCHLGAFLQEYPSPPRSAPLDAAVQAAPPPALSCVFAGTLERGQDLDTVIAAARLLSAAGEQIDIHIAGTGRVEGGLRTAAAAIPGPTRVVVHGLLKRAAYAELLCSCDVGLVAVRPETLVAVPYKACDYAAAGLALVNSLPGELSALIDEHRAGLDYTAGDPESLVRALSVFSKDRSLLQACRQGATRLAEACFDREKTYPRFARWLESMAG